MKWFQWKWWIVSKWHEHKATLAVIVFFALVYWLIWATSPRGMPKLTVTIPDSADHPEY